MDHMLRLPAVRFEAILAPKRLSSNQSEVASIHWEHSTRRRVAALSPRGQEEIEPPRAEHHVGSPGSQQRREQLISAHLREQFYQSPICQPNCYSYGYSV